MTRREFMGDGAAFAATSILFPAIAMDGKKETIKIRQIRNATLRVRFGGVEFLVDPWLAGKSEGMTFRKGAFASEVVDPAQLDIVMPMCELPIPVSDVLSGVDAPAATVIASHMDNVAHASLTRKSLRAALERRGLAGRVLMPDDGEEYSL